MLNSRRNRLIISLVISIVLWMYVVGQTNPDTKTTFKDIPITYINSQSLEYEGLAISSVDVSTVDIKVSGTRSLIGKLENSDIKAEVDLANAAAGKNKLRIEISLPDGIDIEDQSVTVANVNIERSTTAERSVQVVFTGEVNEGYEATSLGTSVDTVTVRGAKSQVDKVAYVAAKISTDKVDKKESSTTVSLVSVDKEGKDVNYIDLSVDSVEVKTALYLVKSVSLDIPINNPDEDGVKRSYTAPDEIKIKGSEASVNGINKISAREITLSGVNSSTDIDIEPILPAGIYVADDSKDLKLIVSVTRNGSKSFKINSNKIEFTDLKSGYSVRTEVDEITVSAGGSQAAINSLNESDIKVSADLNGLGEGTHRVTLIVSGGEGISYTVRPETINITIRED